MSPLLSGRIRAGLAAGEFPLGFRPIAEAHSLALAGVEASLHWRHPDYGPLPAAAFEAALRDADNAWLATCHTIEQICRELATLQQDQPALFVSFPLPARQLLDERLGAFVVCTCARYGVSPRQLMAEINIETRSQIKLLALESVVDGLRGVGVKLALTGFGGGVPAFDLLPILKIDAARLAPTLLDALPADPRAAAVTTGLLEILEALKITAIVDGIGSEAQAHWMAARSNALRQGCHIGVRQESLGAVLEAGLL